MNLLYILLCIIIISVGSTQAAEREMPYSLPLESYHLKIQNPVLVYHIQRLNDLAEQMFNRKCTRVQVDKYRYASYSAFYAITNQLEYQGFVVLATPPGYERTWGSTRVWSLMAWRSSNDLRLMTRLVLEVIEYRDPERPYRIVGGIIRGCYVG